jgi:O-antigen biosynthesis protein
MDNHVPLVSVIICAYADDREVQLLSAINSISRQTLQPSEIIVVIDHNPALQDRIAVQCSQATIIANQSLRGLSGARNTGVKHATGDIVAFIDDDAVADPDWLDRLVKHYTNDAVVAVGGAVVPMWPNKQPSWFPMEFGWVVGCSYTGLPEVTSAIRNPIGCNMSFRRNLFHAIGGFSEGIGRAGADAAGCEETEFCIRARQHNSQSIILYDPSARVHHQVTPERTQWSYFRKRCIAEGKSKALVVANVGHGDGLGSERSYVMKTLPLGALRGLADLAIKRDTAGPARAGAIMAGLAYTTFSYIKSKWARPAIARPFAPIKIHDIETTAPLPAIPAQDAVTGERFGGAFCLLRKNGTPVALLESPLHGANIIPRELQALVSKSLASESAGHDPALLSTTGLAATVVIATRDRPASLAVTLDSILVQDYPNFDIVVVDNAPRSTETADLIARRYASTGRVIYLREDRPGLGRAHNAGMSKVTGTVVAFTDDDVIADPRWLSSIMANFERDEALGCVTGLILPAELETRAQVWTEKHGGFGKGFQRKTYDLHHNRPESPLFPYTAGQFGSGANMAFSTSALRRVGNFDSALGAGTLARGGDDLAAFYAIVAGGFRLVYEPAAVVWHHHRRAEEGMRRQAFSYGMGLGAYLTKIIVDKPATALHLARIFPAGIKHMMGPSAPKSQRLPMDYPKSLVWRERFGILAGVVGYVRSRHALRGSTPKETPNTFEPAVINHQP